MDEDFSKAIIVSPAVLWDGNRQLQGSLELWKTAVIFRTSDFKESNLSLKIPLSNIEKVEQYLVFNLAQNGLRIQDKEGRCDMFVMADVSRFKDMLLKLIGDFRFM